MRRAGRLLAERKLEATRLGRIIQLGGSTVGVDVKTLGSVEPGALHGLDDGARDAARLGVGARDVVSVAGVAVAHDLGQNLGSARTGMLEFLKHDDACALAHHEAVAACVERAARRFGVGVLG